MGWKKMKLSEVLKNREGRYKPNDRLIAGLKRIDKINFSGQIFLSDKDSNTDMILVKKGDLVISGINVEKGALAVYEGEEDILATIHYSSYIFDAKKIDIDFLKVFLRSPDFIQILKEQVPGGIKTEIKPKHILPLEVHFPETINEQKAIAEHFFEKEKKFNQLDEHIAYQLNQLENLNQAILQEAVQGKLVKQDPKDEPANEFLKRIKALKEKSGKKGKSLPPIKPEETPFDIPENWVWCRLGDICDLITSGSRNWNQYYSDKGDLFIRSQNIKNSILNLENRAFVQLPNSAEGQRTKVLLNDILITITGAGVSNCAIVNTVDWENAYVSQHVALIRLIVANISAWCHHCIISESIGKSQFKDLIYGDKPGLNLVQLNNLIIPLPPLAEQKRIVVEIENQLAITKLLKEHINTNQQATEQLLKALLHQEFDVKEMEETVAKPIAKIRGLKPDTVNWDNLVAEPFEKHAAHFVNNIQNIDWEMAIMVACMKNKLGVTYGDVGLQKNVFNTSNLQPIFSKQYGFINSNFGTYSYELKEDLKRNPYIISQKVANNKEVYAVNPKYRKEILSKISAQENREFVHAINRMLSIYEHPFINKETDKIELYNTVLKVALDKNTTDIGVIYQGMKDWEIKQTGYKTKAEKFNKPDTEKMLKLLIEKGVL
jgi:type I restriction enzyme S subunit